MITQFLFGTITGMLQLLFGLLPSLPPMPAVITDGVGYVTDAITSVLGLFAWVYTPTLFIFGMTAVLVTLNFKAIYHFVMFVVRKLPIGSK